MWSLLPLLFAEVQAAPVTLWHAYRGEERAALEELVERYNQEASEPVEALALPYEALYSKFEAAAPRGNGPDLILGAHERVGNWVESGLISAVTLDQPQGMHPTTLEALSYQGSQYGVPLTYKCLALFINSELVPEEPETLSELLRLEQPAGVYPLAYEAASAYHHALWMHAFGAPLEDAEGALRLDRPGSAEALAYAYSLVESGAVPEEVSGALVTQLFNQGQAAAVINGPWFLGDLELDSYRVLPLPPMEEGGQRPQPYLTVEGLLLSAHSPEAQRAPALEFANWLAGDEASLLRAQAGQPVASLSVYQDPSLELDPALAAFRAQLDHALPMPNQPAMAATWEPLARSLRRVLRGSMEPEPAVANAQSEYEVATRPAPPPSEPWPYVLALVAALCGGGWWWSRRPKPSIDYRLRDNPSALFYAGPALGAMVLLSVLPFAVGAAVSLFSHQNGSFTFVGITHFLDILLARDWSLFSPLSFYFTLLVTLLWTVSNLLLHVGLGVGLALILREPWVRLAGVWKAILILPWAVPSYITALVWKGMFHRQFGAINSLLETLGLEPVSWFSQWSTAFTANLCTNTWLGFPFMMVVSLGALASIPRDLEQAAAVDGASAWQRLRHVTLPLLLPALLPAIVLGSIWTFNNFNIIYLVSAGEPDGGTEILISEAYRWAFSRGHRYGYAAAYSLLIFATLVLYSRWTSRLLRSRT